MKREESIRIFYERTKDSQIEYLIYTAENCFYNSLMDSLLDKYNKEEGFAKQYIELSLSSTLRKIELNNMFITHREESIGRWLQLCNTWIERATAAGADVDGDVDDEEQEEQEEEDDDERYDTELEQLKDELYYMDDVSDEYIPSRDDLDTWKQLIELTKRDLNYALDDNNKEEFERLAWELRVFEQDYRNAAIRISEFELD